MKKYIPILGLLLLTVVTLLTNCSKDENDKNQKELLGTWISIDKSDTLHFMTHNDFYKSSGNMTYDHFDYQLFKDSIEIGYSGHLFILILPTMHSYSIDNGQLTIDFSNKPCYGFELEEMTYVKEQKIQGLAASHPASLIPVARKMMGDAEPILK